MLAHLRVPVLLILGASLLPSSAAQARPDDPWIHITVVERDKGGSTVEINLPLAMIGTALSLVPDSALAKGRLQINANGVSLDDIRRLWSQLRATGDAQFVKVREQGSDVTVSREGDLLKVRVDGTGPEAETVRMQLPVALVDALFAGAGDQVNLAGAAKQLETTRGEVLTVEDSDSHVRIWIDERPSSGR